MNQDNQQQIQYETKQDETVRDLNQERQDFERMIARQSEASRQYTMGKLLTA